VFAAEIVRMRDSEIADSSRTQHFVSQGSNFRSRQGFKDWPIGFDPGSLHARWTRFTRGHAIKWFDEVLCLVVIGD